MSGWEFPPVGATAVSRVLRSAVAVATSPFTGTQQVQDWGGAWWEMEIEFAAQQDQAGRSLSAFLASLRGPVNSFVFRDAFIRNPLGLGSPQVNGAGQVGGTLICDGWTGTGLRAGDFFSLGTGTNTRLHQVILDAPPTAGAATLTFVPSLRASPADNAPLNVVNPGVLLRLTSPAPANIGLADLYRFSISAREAL